LSFQRQEFLFGEPKDAATRCAAGVAGLEDLRQLRQAESELQSVLDELNAIDRTRRVHAISGFRSGRAGKYAELFIVAKSIRAHIRQPREFSGA
jgi:hypothetical protein